YMSDFFTSRKLEVENVILEEFNEEGYAQMLREEGRAEGRAEERAKTEAAEERANKAETELVALRAELKALKQGN
ncbi:MAG: hypothetical protein ACI4EN_09945, partial [Butyrivibrio sp.]